MIRDCGGDTGYGQGADEVAGGPRRLRAGGDGRVDVSAAGRELGLSPAVISKRIRRLEERLGTRLLQRTTRQIALTEAGQGFYERVGRDLASAEEAEAWVSRRSSVVRGLLRVSAPTSFGRLHVAPHITAFLDAWPS